MIKIRNLNRKEEVPVELNLSNPIVIGKNASCDVQLPRDTAFSLSISRRHAFLVGFNGSQHFGNFSTNSVYLEKAGRFLAIFLV